MGLNQEPRTTDPLHKYAHSIQHMSCMGRIVITMITKYVIYEPCMSCSMSHDEALDVHGSGQSCQRHLACVLSSLPRTARGQACHLFGATSVNTLRVTRTLQYEPQICVEQDYVLPGTLQLYDHNSPPILWQVPNNISQSVRSNGRPQISS